MTPVRIMLQCPTTKKIMWTGMFAAGAEIFRTTTFEAMRVDCPYCSRIHPWSTKDAFLEETKPPSSRA